RTVLSGGGGSAAGEEGSGSPGEPGRISPPVPRSLLPRWDPPPSVRGTRVTVHVEVGRDGRPTGRVRLEPPTGNESFDRRLREALTSIRYRPARRAGEPVVAWAEITFVF
ncbi:MAG: energy transducer TonB, partial [Gemmatimonadota bacterium]